MGSNERNFAIPLGKYREEDSMSQGRMFNETISDILKASLVGILVVVISVIPLEQILAQLFGLPFEEFRGGMPTPYLFQSLNFAASFTSW